MGEIEKKIIKDVLTADLIPYDKNYLDHKNNVDHIKNSLIEFGYAKVSIIVDENMVLLAGHGTLKAIQSLGWDTVPEVLQITGYEEVQKSAYRIADNTTSKKAKERRDFLLQELGLIGTRYDMNKFGLEIDKIYKDLDNSRPEIEFTEELSEEHNYVVLYFDNDIDWLQAQTLLDIKTVKALDSRPGFEKMGIGRVLKGVDAIKSIQDNANIN